MNKNLIELKKSGVVLGTSFAPELVKVGTEGRLGILKFAVEDLNMRNIRLGLRWNRVEKSPRRLDLSFYRPYLEYCFNKKIKICLNVGPIKTFRWPEAHIPEFILKKRGLDAGQKVGEINLDDDLSKMSLEYLSSLLELLKKEYGKDLKNSVIQPENEPFYPFGIYKLHLGVDHLIAVVEMIREHFPKNKVMLNSAGRVNLRKIVKFIEASTLKDTDFEIGFNYYYKTEVVSKIPLIRELDPLFFVEPWSLTTTELKSIAQNKNIQIEISEAQFEPWLDQTDPGNKYDDLVRLLEGCARVFPPDQKQKLIRLWGIEGFALKFLKHCETADHQKMKELICKINSSIISS